MNGRLLFTTGFLFLVVCHVLGMVQASADDWKYDQIRLKNGHRFDGLLVSEQLDQIHFRYVVRNPGVKTLVFDTTFDKDEIDQLIRLTPAERRELANRLNQLDRNGEREKERMAKVTVSLHDWELNPKEEGRTYKGKYFEITSNIDATFFRQVVVRLEDIFQAYVDNLGARLQPKQPVKVLLFRNMNEYRQWLLKQGLNLLNPAYYDARKDLMVAGSDLDRLEASLKRTEAEHQEKLKAINDYHQRLLKHYSGKPPHHLLQQIKELQLQIRLTNQDNQSTLDKLREQFFAMLYHEAFHAFLDHYVYPHRELQTPRWLNEGLAQIFETAVVETGELRVGHVDTTRLTALQAALKDGSLLSVRDLLQADAAQFNVHHSTEAYAADRTYLAAWALAYYLAFDRKLLGKEAMHQFVLTSSSSKDQTALFEKLVDQPLPEFERQFRDYFTRLRPDGSLKPQSSADQSKK